MSQYSKRHQRRLASAFYNQSALAPDLMESYPKGPKLEPSSEIEYHPDPLCHIIVDPVPEKEPPGTDVLNENIMLKARIAELEEILGRPKPVPADTAVVELRHQVSQMQAQLHGQDKILSALTQDVKYIKARIGPSGIPTVSDLPRIPLTTMEDLKLMDEALKYDPDLKKNLKQQLKVAKHGNNLKPIIADILLNQFTLSKSHMKVRGLEKILGDTSAFITLLIETFGLSEMKVQIAAVRSRCSSQRSNSRKKMSMKETMNNSSLCEETSANDDSIIYFDSLDQKLDLDV